MTIFFEVLGWLVNSRFGQALILAAAILIAAAAAFHWADARGYTRAHAEFLAGQAQAQAAQQQAERTATSSAETIADSTRAQAQRAVQATASSTETTKEVIRYVYLNPPKTAPVAAGSCVHPLDDRVQQRLDQAVDAANAASGGLPATGDRTDSRPAERL